MMIRPSLCSVILALLLKPCFSHEHTPVAASDINQSFAEQYGELADLLSKVEDRLTAIEYRPRIEEQIDVLASNQSSGEAAFNRLSKQEKKLFIKKFQNNRYHCGEVTQVMQERQRILLDPELSKLLRDLLIKIP